MRSTKPPFIGQERSDTCMLACLRMLLAHRGTDVTEAALLRETSEEQGGLNPEQLAQLAQRHGLRAEARQLTWMELQRSWRWSVFQSY